MPWGELDEKRNIYKEKNYPFTESEKYRERSRPWKKV
jgi:hypothetical protein